MSTNRTCNVELLSKAECNLIVCRALKLDRADIVEFKIEYLSDDVVGFLGEYFKLKVLIGEKNANYKELHFFMKSLPIDQPKHREHLEHFGICRKEGELYSTILNEMGAFSKTKWRPDCYLSRKDLLVLEDMSTGGYATLLNDSLFKVDHVQASLKSLAAMHASSIAWEISTRKNIGEEFKEILFETSIADDNQWFLTGVRGLQAAVATHPKYQSDKHQDFIDNRFCDMFQPAYDVVGASKKFRNVLCHRDTWGKNILFKIDENDKQNGVNAVLVDFQTCRYCQPAVDVLFCIYMNTTRDDRDFIYDQCLQYYYKELTKEMKDLNLSVDDHLTFKDFLDSCAETKLLPVLYNCIAITLTRLPKDYLMNLRKTDENKYEFYTLIDRREMILNNLYDDFYRNSLYEGLDELMEIICPIK